MDRHTAYAQRISNLVDRQPVLPKVPNLLPINSLLTSFVDTFGLSLRYPLSLTLANDVSFELRKSTNHLKL